MAELISFEQIRRAERVVHLVVEGVGVEHYLQVNAEPRLASPRVDETLEICCDWLARRTDSAVSEATRAYVRKQLRRKLIEAVAERLLRQGF